MNHGRPAPDLHGWANRNVATLFPLNKKFGLISSKILTDKCAPRTLRATTQGVVLLQSRSAGNAKPNADGAKQFCGRKGDSDFRPAGGCLPHRQFL